MHRKVCQLSKLNHVSPAILNIIHLEYYPAQKLYLVSCLSILGHQVSGIHKLLYNFFYAFSVSIGACKVVLAAYLAYNWETCRFYTRPIVLEFAGWAVSWTKQAKRIWLCSFSNHWLWANLLRCTLSSLLQLKWVKCCCWGIEELQNFLCIWKTIYYLF